MTIDERIAALLREGAPPRRDAMFRLRVLERRERQRFRRRVAMTLLAAGAAIVVACLGYSASIDAAEKIGVLLLYMALAASAFMHAPVLSYFVRRFLRQSDGPLRR